MALAKREPDGSINYYTADNNPKNYSWFGRAWRNAIVAINNNKSLITGAVGSPLGSILGLLIDAGVKVTLSEKVSFIDITATLTTAEQKIYNLFIQRQFIPALKPLFEQFNISVSSSSRSIVSPLFFVRNTNLVLLKLAALENYAKSIIETGETGFSANLTQEKASFILRTVGYLEKALIKHTEETTTGFKLVEEVKVVSDTTDFGVLQLDFNGETVKGKVKSYILENSEPTSDQVVIADVNTNIDDNPVSNTNTDVAVAPSPKIEEKNSGLKKGLKIVAFGSLAFWLGSLVNSNSNKNKN